MAAKSKLFAGSALFAVALIAAPASAQQAPTDTGANVDDAIDVITVTARRQSETLAEVPASVTVFTDDVIQQAQIDTAEDFLALTPGVTIVTGTAEAGDTQINIRGINGARDAESSVALVVDGILKTNTAQLNQRQGTLRQIEILKGPQGALYGRNAAAGAIVVQTLKPGDVFEAGGTARYAEQDTIEADAYVAGPLGDNLGFVVAGSYRTTDGDFRNEFLGTKTVDDQEIWSIDGRLVAELGATEIDAKVRYADLSGASINFNAAFHLPNFAGVDPNFFEDVNDHPFNYYSNIRPTNDQESFDASVKIDHDFDTVRLTAWALYSDVDQSLVADGTSADFARYIPFPAPNDVAGAVAGACFATTAELTGFPVNSPGFIGTSPVPFIFDPANGSTFGPYSPTTCDGTQYQIRTQEDYSAELRLSSNTDGPLQWGIGGYYLNIDREVGVSLGADLGQGVIRELYNEPGSANPTSQLYNDRFETDVYAAFGNVDFEVNDRLKLGAAFRYDIEDREVTNLVPNVLDPITGEPINPGQAFGPIGPQSESFKQLQPKISFNWEILDGQNLYGNWGIGFKSGGFNNQGSAAIVDSAFNQFIDAGVTIEDIYDKETSSAFELGLRGEAGPFRYDIAGYYTEVDDMQFFEFFVGGFGLLRVVSNIDEVELYGLEGNLTTEPVEGWTLFGSFNVTESEIKDNASRPDTVGNQSPYTADYTVNLGSQIEAPITRELDLTMRADYRITGPTWFHTVQDQTRPTLFSGLLPISALALPAEVGDGQFGITEREAFGVLDLRLGLASERFNIAVFAENALNRKYLNEVIPAIEFGGSFISPGTRRRVGVEAGFRF
ncbi:MAG: TonB-dependent receptor [Pacificimonas sp.]